jgi:hypothetical protein
MCRYDMFDTIHGSVQADLKKLCPGTSWGKGKKQVNHVYGTIFFKKICEKAGVSHGPGGLKEVEKKVQNKILQALVKGGSKGIGHYDLAQLLVFVHQRISKKKGQGVYGDLSPHEAGGVDLFSKPIIDNMAKFVSDLVQAEKAKSISNLVVAGKAY